ncbi:MULTISPECIES: hypothetical protein [Derxia]|uniref:Uncharacterized protein n=1 Tax=Derxia gummosa DSM 723 TaxID=1121388 RepID=A0A8B6X846_9BURK|nr:MULTISPECIES: hypothetical protein [Derxia]
MPSLEEARALLAANPFPPNPWIEITDDAILIKCGFTDTLERILRWVPKARWVSEKRHWTVPLTAAEMIRSVLPEVSRLAEATLEEDAALRRARARSLVEPQAPVTPPAPRVAPAELPTARDLFRDSARLLFGTDWQRDTARALGRDEPALACWLVGEQVVEADESALLGEMLDLMRRRAVEITAAADRFERVKAALAKPAEG